MSTPWGGYDIIIDPVMGGSIARFIGKLANRGRYVQVAAAAGFPPSNFGLALMGAFARSPTYGVFSMASVGDDELRSAGAALFAAALAGRLALPEVIGYSLHQAADAHARLERGWTFRRSSYAPRSAGSRPPGGRCLPHRRRIRLR